MMCHVTENNEKEKKNIIILMPCVEKRNIILRKERCDEHGTMTEDQQ